MPINDSDVLTYGNRAQTKMMEMTDIIEVDLRNGVANDELLVQFMELYDVQEALFSQYNDWTLEEKERVITFMTDLYELAEIAYTEYDMYILPVTVPEDTANGNYVTHPELNGAITIVNNRIDGIEERVEALEAFDYSTIIPQELLDAVAASTAKNEEQDELIDEAQDAILDLETDLATHINDTSKHVSSTDRTNWNGKANAADVATALAGKANSNHTHEMSQVNGLLDALNTLNTEIAGVLDGEDGQDGVTPAIGIGTVETGDTPSVTIDPGSTTEAPILNFVIPKGEKGDAFEFDAIDLLANRSDYDGEELGFTFLASDTGDYYILEESGWSDPIAFQGDNGWSPKLGTYVVSASKIVWELLDWIGGSGDKPDMPYPVGVDPSEVRFFISSTGFVTDPNQATNVQGPIGGDGEKGEPFMINAQGTDRSIYDDSVKGFTFLNTTTGMVNFKVSDADADWSADYLWTASGEEGPEGPPGPSSQFLTELFVADGIASVFEVSGGTVEQLVFVIVNGGVQNPTSYSVVGNQIDFTTPPLADDKILIGYFENISVGEPGAGTQNISEVLGEGNNAGAQQIKNIGTGTDAGDAVNVAQMTAAIMAAVEGLFDLRGVYDASINAYPTTGGSGAAGAILKSDAWIITVAGVLPTGQNVAPGDLLFAIIDTPGSTQANWGIVNNNLTYVPVNKAGDTMSGNLAMSGNKVTGLADGAGSGEAATYNQLTAAIAAIPKFLPFALSDELSVITTTGTRLTVRAPHALTITSVRASLNVAQSSGSILTLDVKVNGVTIFSTLLTIDNTEKTSVSAATPAVISAGSVADDDELTFLITQVGVGDATGLKIRLYYA